jgi:hypothetical protein
MKKTEKLRELCRNSDEYRNHWDKKAGAVGVRLLTTTEKVIEKLPEESRRLLGDRIAELTAALGVPPCGRCNERKKWLNEAHEWILKTFS